MTVFQLITSIQLGGAENIAISIGEYCKLKDTKINIVLLELHKTKNPYALDLKKRIQEAGMECRTLGVNNKYISLLIAPFMLLYYIIRKKPSVIHSHTDLPDFVLSITLRFPFKKKFKIIRTIHNTELWSNHYYIGQVTEKSFLNNNIVAVSDSAMQAYKNLRTRYNLKISPYQHLIYNGVKIPQKEYYPFKTDNQKINIVFAGRLEEQKGIDIFLDLLSSISPALQSQFCFHIVGDGTFKKKVVALCENSQFCYYYGTVSNLANKLHHFNYLLMPSRFEGFGLLSVEASLAGVPVILAEIPGLSETLPENWPLQAKSLDVNHFLNLLQNIANNQYNYKELQQKAFEYASHEFSYTKMGERYLTLYNSLSN